MSQCNRPYLIGKKKSAKRCVNDVKNDNKLINKKRISEMLPFQTVGKHCRDTFFILLYI